MTTLKRKKFHDFKELQLWADVRQEHQLISISKDYDTEKHQFMWTVYYRKN